MESKVIEVLVSSLKFDQNLALSCPEGLEFQMFTLPRTHFGLPRTEYFEFCHATRRERLLDLYEASKTDETTGALEL